MKRWVRQLAVVLAGATLVPVVFAGSAAAVESTGDGPWAGGFGTLSADDLGDFPQDLQFLVPGAPAFAARYFGDKRVKAEAPLMDGSALASSAPSGSCADDGGDVGLYVIDFMRRYGEVLDAVSHLPSQEPLAFSTAPWPGSAVEAIGRKDLDGVDPNGGVLPLVGYFIDFEKRFARLPEPHYISSCGEDLAQFGVADARSPWGFTFVDAPDQGSIS